MAISPGWTRLPGSPFGQRLGMLSTRWCGNGSASSIFYHKNSNYFLLASLHYILMINISCTYMQKNIYSSEMLIRKGVNFILLSNDYLYKEYFFDNIGYLIIQINNACGQVERIKLSRQALYCFVIFAIVNKILITKYRRILVFKNFLLKYYQLYRNRARDTQILFIFFS